MMSFWYKIITYYTLKAKNYYSWKFLNFTLLSLGAFFGNSIVRMTVRCAYYWASKERSLREFAQNRSYAKEAFLYRELLKPALRLPETTVPVEGIPMHYRISRRA